MAILSASALSLAYGNSQVFTGVSLEVQPRSHIGIVGRNGTGKTSLVRTLLGDIEPTGGEVNIAKGLRLGYVPQAAMPLADGTLRDELLLAFQRHREIEAEMASLAQAMLEVSAEERQALGRRYAALEDEYEVRGGYNQDNALERAAAGVGLSEAALETPSAKASGGERTRAALARGLLAEPDLLVLDEPTNHLDLSGLAWLERFLFSFRHAFIVISHDRHFLDRVTEETWELENGRLRAFPGNYTRYKALKAELLERQRREFEKQQTYIAKEEEFIRRYGAGQRAQEAQGRETRLRRLERVDAPEAEEALRVFPSRVARSPQVVLKTRGLRAGVTNAEGPPLVLAAMPDVDLGRGSRTALIGPNGAGKTTLLRTLLGHIPPISGEASIAQAVTPGYYRQGLEDLPSSKSVMEALAEVWPVGEERLRSHLARFLFKGDDVHARVGVLSGGERARLALARLLAEAPNLLVLDEPTNHLDIAAQEALEDVLLGYEGTLLFVSHDRRLISKLAKELWVLEAGAVSVFSATYEEWEAARVATERAAKEERAAVRSAPKAPRPPQPRNKPREEEQAAKRVAQAEERLKAIEQQLAAASEGRDIEAIAKLGGEYRTAQGEVERAMSEWEKAASG